MSSRQPDKTPSSVGLRTLIIFVSVAIALEALAAYIEIRLLNDWQTRSSFGEMFGAVNTLFSGLALAGVIYTVLIQRHEIEMQRRSQARSDHLMALTAKLSALNSLVEATSNQLRDMRAGRDSAESMKPVSEKLQGYLLQISAVLKEMNESKHSNNE